MDENEILELLKSRLSLDVEHDEVYTGDMDGSGQLYETDTRVILRLDGEEISSVTID